MSPRANSSNGSERIVLAQCTDSNDVERVREVYGERSARRYRALVDLKQTHLSEFTPDRWLDRGGPVEEGVE